MPSSQRNPGDVVTSVEAVNLAQAAERELHGNLLPFWRTRCLDENCGGFVAAMDNAGQLRPEAPKGLILNARLLWTFAALFRELRDERDRKLAGRAFGYLEARAPDWSPATELRLSDRDMDEPRSMNAHLHVLEAYANLYRAHPDPGVAERLRELIQLFDDHILDDGRCHLRHFFDEDWNVRSDSYTYGHDIEAAWLLVEAAEVLGDPSLEAKTRDWAPRIASAVLGEAVDADGGLAYEGRGGRVIDPNREWWCQAEAVVGFLCAHSLTGEARFREAAGRVWRFIDRSVVDHEAGDWFWRVFPDGSPDASEPKVSEWKGPYHTVRMCLEVMRRAGG